MRNGTSDHKKPRWGAVRRCLCAVLMLASLITGMIPVAAAEREQPEIAVDLLGGSEGYSAVLYNNTNGLPTSEANTIAETSDGFLWIGSYGGLVRYDGKNFERIDSTTTGISSVVSLFVDSKDRLWIGTNDSGVAVMGKGSLRVYNKGDGLRSLFVRAVVEDQSGGIYIATTQGVVAVNDDMTLRQVDEPQISTAYVHDLDVGAGNVIYGRTTDGAVFTMEDGKLTGYYDGAKLGIGGIHCVSPDRDKAGYVYLGTTESEVYYGELDGGADHMERIDISPLEYTNEIFHYGDQLWICADNGIGVVTPDGLTVLDELPMNSSVERILTDYQGNLWFTSSKQGVMKVVPNQFSDLFGQYGLKGEVVNATCIYDDKIFVGTKKSGLIVLDEEGVVEELPLTSAVTAGGKTVEETDLIRMLRGSQIRMVLDLFRIPAEEKKLTLAEDLDLPDDSVMIDGHCFRRILGNLVSNAVKFTPEGGTVTVSARQTQVSETGHARFEFAVADTGVGIAEEFLPRIFEVFQQEASSTKTGSHGTGLGLSIVKSLLDAMGGTVTVASKKGEVSVFTVHLPLKLSKHEPEPQAEPLPTPQGTGRRILLVEDMEINRLLAETILQESGFQVVSVPDGCDAVDAVSCSPERYFDLVLMDIQMPVMNGYEAARAIRALQRQDVRDLPILALSANAREEDRRASLESGMNDHIAKPFQPAMLVQTVSDYIAARPEPEQA